MYTENDTFNALKTPPTEDQIAFGRNSWVYCRQHLRPHKTGWCSVPNFNKTKLDATTDLNAHQECIRRGFYVYSSSCLQKS